MNYMFNDIALQAFEELRCVRRAQHHLQCQINRAVRHTRHPDPSISMLVAQIARLTARVEELERRQARRDSAGARLFKSPTGDSA